MGGIIIIISVLVPVLLFCDLTNIYVILLVITTLWCGALGYADDYIKVYKHDKEGLHPKVKLAGQIVLGFIVGLAVCFSNDIVVREKVPVKVGEQNIVEQGNTHSLNVDSETLVAQDVEDGERRKKHEDDDSVREGSRVRLQMAVTVQGSLGLVLQMGNLRVHDSDSNHGTV